MIRGLFSQFRQVLYFVASPGIIPTDILHSEIKKCLNITENMGLNVRALVCDQGPTNRKLYNQLGISFTTPCFSFNQKQISGLYDACHLIKSVRNNFKKSNLKTPDGEISWEIIIFLYEFEKTSSTKLTSKHIFPTDFEKMNVRLAVQVLIHSVYCGIQSLLQHGKYPRHFENIAISTAKFIEKVNKLFDILNGRIFLRPG